MLNVASSVLQSKELGRLLDEDPSLMSRRKAAGQRLDLLKRARDEIDAVGWGK